MLPVDHQLAVQSLQFFSDSACTSELQIQASFCSEPSSSCWRNSQLLAGCSCDKAFDDETASFWVSGQEQGAHFLGVQFYHPTFVGCVRVRGRLLPPTADNVASAASQTFPAIQSAGVALQSSLDGSTWEV